MVGGAFNKPLAVVGYHRLRSLWLHQDDFHDQFAGTFHRIDSGHIASMGHGERQDDTENILLMHMILAQKVSIDELMS